MSMMMNSEIPFSPPRAGEAPELELRPGNAAGISPESGATNGGHVNPRSQHGQDALALSHRPDQEPHTELPAPPGQNAEAHSSTGLGQTATAGGSTDERQPDTAHAPQASQASSDSAPSADASSTLPSDTPRISRAELVKESAQWMEVITSGEMSPERYRWLTDETIENFRYYYNASYVDVRKAAGGEAMHSAIEWTGKGSLLYDLDGSEIIDCLGSYGVYSAGIRHPKIVDAVRAQAARMPLSSQELLDPLRGALARLLGEIAPGDLQYSFFMCNGTDAVDGAMKLARLNTKKTGFISSIGGFHGKSMGSLSLMGKSKYRTPYEPLLPEVFFVPFGDANAVEEELWKASNTGKGIAAVVMEPVQGENGAMVPPDDYFPRLRELCDQYECLLIADEVQTGLGRTGKLFGVDHWGVVPDIMCLGKFLGGGVMPLSAFISTPKLWEIYNDNPLLQTSTFGGNPLACAAGIAAIHVTLDEDLPGQAARKGAWLLESLRRIAANYPELVSEVRGLGLLQAIEFQKPEYGWDFCTALYDRGVLVAGTLSNAKTVRFEPALNIPDELLAKVVERSAEAMQAVKAKNPDARVPAPDAGGRLRRGARTGLGH